MAAAWGDNLESERIAELVNWERQGNSNSAGRTNPFAGKTLTGADVFWLAAHVLASATGDHRAAEQRLRDAQTDTLLRVSLDLSALNLQRAVLSGANLHGAILGKAHLEGAICGMAILRDAFLGDARLDHAFLDRAHLEGAYLSGACLNGASLYAAHLEGASLKQTQFDSAILKFTTLDGADLAGANLALTDLTRASLVGVSLAQADLSKAVLFEAHLERASLKATDLSGADLRRTTFDATSRLNEAKLEHAALYQASFDRTNLAVIEWRAVRRLGDDLIAKDPRLGEVHYNTDGTRMVKEGKRKTAKQREEDYIAAARAYRALSVELHAQGVVKDATRFHFRAEVMSRRVSLHRAVRRLRTPGILIAPLLFLPWLLSLLLSVVAGYGIYHVWRLAITYLVVVGAFAGSYWLIGAHVHPGLGVLDAVVLSLTSFHGRGLQPTGDLTDPMRAIAGAEAVLGLLIEGLFIAAFTRRITGS